jgi:hypothetical protein
MKKNSNGEFERFNEMMEKLVRVPHDKLRQKLEEEEKGKKKKPSKKKRASVRVSGGKD